MPVRYQAPRPFKLIPDPSTLYIFVLQRASLDNTSGDMPRGCQFGYIFTGAITDAAGSGMSKNDITGRTVAHELGHGTFKLRHTFDSEYRIAKATTDNLMDYSWGRDLVKHQWDAIHAPGLVIGLFERDEDAMQTSLLSEEQKKQLKILIMNALEFTAQKQGELLYLNEFHFSWEGNSNKEYFGCIDFAGQVQPIFKNNFMSAMTRNQIWSESWVINRNTIKGKVSFTIRDENKEEEKEKLCVREVYFSEKLESSGASSGTGYWMRLEYLRGSTTASNPAISVVFSTKEDIDIFRWGWDMIYYKTYLDQVLKHKGMDQYLKSLERIKNQISEKWGIEKYNEWKRYMDNAEKSDFEVEKNFN